MAVNRRLVVGGLIIGGGGIIAYEVYKYQKNKSAANAAATSSAAAATGYGYGAASPYGYGQESPYGYGASGVGVTYGYGASGGFPAGYYGYGMPEPPVGSPPPIASTTNAQWDQAAITQLQQDGYDAQTVSGALGAYLNGREVNSAQVNIVDAAIGIEGYPPVAGASGYPPAIKTGGTPGGGGGGGQGGGGTVKVPSVVGERAETGEAKIRAAGLKVREAGHRNAKGPAHITSTSPAGGATAKKGATVTVRIAQGAK
jgi:hypothetical protein